MILEFLLIFRREEPREIHNECCLFFSKIISPRAEWPIDNYGWLSDGVSSNASSFSFLIFYVLCAYYLR